MNRRGFFKLFPLALAAGAAAVKAPVPKQATVYIDLGDIRREIVDAAWEEALRKWRRNMRHLEHNPHVRLFNSKLEAQIFTKEKVLFIQRGWLA